jgi:hypothetical protein
MTDTLDMQVIAHPRNRGCWTVRIGDAIYGSFPCRATAVAAMLTYSGR